MRVFGTACSATPKSSMSRDDAVYVGHMLDTARKAVEKVDRTSRAAFDSDENLRLALAYLIQIIGEAANRVSPRFREAHADIPGAGERRDPWAARRARDWTHRPCPPGAAGPPAW